MPKACKTLLGFDFGMKRIGVAVGQTLLQNANPLTTLTANKGIPDWRILQKLVEEWQPQLLIVGMPLNMDGSEQDITVAAKHFVHHLAEWSDLPVVSVDERLTTIEARQIIFDHGGFKALKKAEIDSVAAKIILEHWMIDHYDNEAIAAR